MQLVLKDGLICSNHIRRVITGEVLLSDAEEVLLAANEEVAVGDGW